LPETSTEGFIAAMSNAAVGPKYCRFNTSQRLLFRQRCTIGIVNLASLTRYLSFDQVSMKLGVFWRNFSDFAVWRDSHSWRCRMLALRWVK
jgi:hypothetical protein